MAKLKKPNSVIVAALITFLGTIIAAILLSPQINNPSKTSNVTFTITPTPSITIFQPFLTLKCTNPIQDNFCRFEVRGNASGWASLTELRVYVFVNPTDPPGSGWYLQESPGSIELNGSWIQTPSHVGSDPFPARTGDKLIIRAILVQEDATLNSIPLKELLLQDDQIVLSAIEDIKSIVAISNLVELTVDR